jgi:hypothetical protein
LENDLSHAYPNAVTFQVVDDHHKNSARGDAIGPLPGLIRPLLDWTTTFAVPDHFQRSE